MSESHDDAAGDGSAREAAGRDDNARSTSSRSGEGGDGSGGRRSPAGKLGRRGWTVLLSGILVLTFVLLGTFVRVPYVVLGPGPTYNTLDKVGGTPVIKVSGHETYPANGALRMTTVSFSDEVTLFGALGMWLSGRYALAPREAYFERGQTEQEFEQHSKQLFQRSQSNAELAAFHHLGYPTKVVVTEVLSGTPADSPAKGAFASGEQVVAVDGKPVSTVPQVHEALAGTSPGQTISVTVAGGESGGTDGKGEQTRSITLGKHPGGKQQTGFIGLELAERAAVRFDVDVTLDEVGGPSAGVMFALGIVDRLTPGSLTGGKAVAGTGTIEPTGEVGAIGGISFKLVAAHEAGAEIFMVPARNCAAAVETAPAELELVKVNNLGDAVTALEDIAAGRPAKTC